MMSVKVEIQPIPSTSKLHTIADGFVRYTFGKKGTVQFVPEGVFEILFHPDAGIFHKSKNEKGWVKRPLGFIGGLHTEAYQVKLEKDDVQCYGLKIKPEKAKFLFSEKLTQFKNNVIALEEIWEKDGKYLTEAIAHESNFKKKENLLESFITKKINDFQPKLHLSFYKIIQSNCSITVDELAKRSLKSYSHFRKLFKEEIGLSPKEYIKVIRIQRAIQLLRAKNKTSLTSLAYELGYFDQAHFIHDFKAITQSSPKIFAKSL